MKNHLQIMLLIPLVVFITSCKKSVQQPNIILIMTDDQGWSDVGFNGNTEIKTPWLDLLASKGVIFDRFYSASAECSPTRASVITGRNPLRLNIPFANKGHLLEEEITIPEILKKEGYATGHFGKWHLGTLTKSVIDANRGGREAFLDDYTIPTEHGYDRFFCTESKVPTFDPMVFPASFNEGESKRYGWKAIAQNDSIKNYGTAYWSNSNQKELANVSGNNARVLLDRVIPFIENALKEDQSFFTTIWFHTPHLPVVSDSIHRSYYGDMNLDKQLYYGAITALDEQIGRLWNKLGEAGIQEKTIIFFCSDNGPENRTPGRAGVFRERKRSLYEGGIRVPAFAIWKNNLKGGRRIDFPAVTSDYLPTIMDILEIEYPDGRPIDGISIWEALKGNEKERGTPIGFIRKPQVSWVTNQFKLINHEKEEIYELYDLLNDKAEKENIIKKHPEIAREMKADLLKWLSSVDNSSKGMDYNK